VNDRERAQIALILQRASKIACATLDEGINAVYSQQSAKGALHSGSTIRAAVDVMDKTLSDLVPQMVQRVAATVLDKAAFDELTATLQQILDEYHARLAGVVKVADGRGGRQAPDRAVVAAADTMFNNWRSDFEGQVAILAYDFEPQAPATPIESPVPAVTKKGGRPPKDFWDDMWAAIAVSLYVGDLKPKTQADVANAMNDWIDRNGLSAAPSTVQARARRLWDLLLAAEE
jgi:hypothetical protein